MSNSGEGSRPNFSYVKEGRNPFETTGDPFAGGTPKQSEATTESSLTPEEQARAEKIAQIKHTIRNTTITIVSVVGVGGVGAAAAGFVDPLLPVAAAGLAVAGYEASKLAVSPAMKVAERYQEIKTEVRAKGIARAVGEQIARVWEQIRPEISIQMHGKVEQQKAAAEETQKLADTALKEMERGYKTNFLLDEIKKNRFYVNPKTPFEKAQKALSERETRVNAALNTSDPVNALISFEIEFDRRFELTGEGHGEKPNSFEKKRQRVVDAVEHRWQAELKRRREAGEMTQIDQIARVDNQPAQTIQTPKTENKVEDNEPDYDDLDKQDLARVAHANQERARKLVMENGQIRQQVNDLRLMFNALAQEVAANGGKSVSEIQQWAEDQLVEAKRPGKPNDMYVRYITPGKK